MGALAAFLAGDSADQPEAVTRMLQAAPHRGENVRLHTEGRCRLGVAWSDGVSDASIAAENGLALALCGRIDNLKDLASRFTGRSRAPTSQAGVVLAAFRALGDDAPDALRGAFSGVFTNGSSIRAFRDHLGLGVLHYGLQGGDVYVATEARQVLAGAGSTETPDPEFLESLLFDRYEDETLCALRGVRRLPQGSILAAAPTSVTCTRYWRPDELLETARLTGGEVQATFDDLMSQAVARVLTGNDVLALSGGIESTAIAAYANPEHRRRWGRPLTALSAVYPNFPGIDERASIELVAHELGLELHLFEPQTGPVDRLREWVGRVGWPAPASFASSRELYLAARRLGHRTILSGNYGELATDVGLPHVLTHLVRTGRLRAVGVHIRAERARGVSLESIARQLARASMPAALGDALDRHRHPGRHAPDWLDRARMPQAALKQVRARGRWHQAQLASFYTPRLQLEADDVEQAFSGVQVRWPWVDVDLWEFFLRLPAEAKYPTLRPRKALVRRLLRGRVPDAILDKGDKTVYGPAEMRAIDYGFLRGLLRDPALHVAGVDYRRLGEHLDAEDLAARDFRYVRNLAAIHIFLEQWGDRAPT